MEGDHAAIFKDGEQLSERHGELMDAWAANAPLPPKEDKARAMTDSLIEKVSKAADESALLEALDGEAERKQLEWLKAKRPDLLAEVNEATDAKRKALTGGELPL